MEFIAKISEWPLNQMIPELSIDATCDENTTQVDITPLYKFEMNKIAILSYRKKLI